MYFGARYAPQKEHVDFPRADLAFLVALDVLTTSTRCSYIYYYKNAQNNVMLIALNMSL